MNVASYNQQLIRGASESNVIATGLKSVKNRTKQQRTNSADTTTPKRRKTDKVQISKTGAALARASTAEAKKEAAHATKRETVIQHIVGSEVTTEEKRKSHKATRQRQSIFKNSVENHSNPGANNEKTSKITNSATNFSEYLMPSQNHGIDRVMSKYKEAQGFMAQISSESINSIA